jgi:uncharacterized metal-binding protein YceD (DUF177 family)
MIMRNCWFFHLENLNIAQYIYEMIALSVPLRQVHPGARRKFKTEALED